MFYEAKLVRSSKKKEKEANLEITQDSSHFAPPPSCEVDPRVVDYMYIILMKSPLLFYCTQHVSSRVF